MNMKLFIFAAALAARALGSSPQPCELSSDADSAVELVRGRYFKCPEGMSLQYHFPTDQSRPAVACVCDQGQSGTLRCGDSVVPFSSVNDGYCDIGCDEPLTASCSSGLFFCRNENSIPKILSSSKVFDGVHDCCDCSDELGDSTCVDTCDEEGEETKALARKQQKTWEDGRKALAALTDPTVGDRTELEKATSALKQAKLDLAAIVKHPTPFVEFFFPQGAGGGDDDLTAEQSKMWVMCCVAMPVLETGKWEILESLPNRLFRPSKSAHTLAEKLSDMKSVFPNGTKESFMNRDPLTNEIEVLYDLLIHVEKHLEKDFVREAISRVLEGTKKHELCLSKLESSYKDSCSWSEEDKKRKLAQVSSTSTAAVGSGDEDEEIAVLRGVIERLKEEQRNAQMRLDNAAAIAPRESEHDVGNEKQLLTLVGSSFSTKVNQYEYKIEPFKEIKQSHVSLGKYHDWEADFSLPDALKDPASPDPTFKMMFTKGTRCHQGTIRSTDVYFRCGAAPRTVDVVEPEMCRYEIVFEHPAACVEGLKKATVADSSSEDAPSLLGSLKSKIGL